MACGGVWRDRYGDCTETPVSGDTLCPGHVGSASTITAGESVCPPCGGCWVSCKDGPVWKRVLRKPGGVRDVERKEHGQWVPGAHLSKASVHMWEGDKLPKRPANAYHKQKAGGSCGRDPRKEVSEVSVSRKSSGVLTMVCACHFIFGIDALYASESCTQVAIFVSRMKSWLSGLTYVFYDNACGVRRFLAARIRVYTDKGEEVPPALITLAGLVWIIDRLHFRYHRGCRLQGTQWYVEGVDPYDYDGLKGLNTQANEQVFSMTDRWLKTLNATGVWKHKLLLMVFAHNHNQRIDGTKAYRLYKKRLALPDDWVRPVVPDVAKVDGSCPRDDAVDQLLGKRQRRSDKLVQPPDACAADGVPTGEANRGRELRIFEADDVVVVHRGTNKVHLVHPDFPNGKTACARWGFYGRGVQSRSLSSMLVSEDWSGYVACGSCCGARDLPLRDVLGVGVIGDS